MNIVSIELNFKAISLAFVTVVLSIAASSLSAQNATDIQVTSAVQQAAVNRLGVNLGDQSYWDSGQLLKNLTFRNPGFEGLMYRSILKCAAVTANTCMDDNQYSRQQTGYWAGGSYLVISGNSAGKTGTVVQSTQNLSGCSGCGQIVTFDQNINASVGDYFVVTNSFPGSGDAGWWDNTQNGATITTELNDLSPNTPGKQALVLTAAGSGQLASVASYFDSYSKHSFIQMNGAFQVAFRAKGIGGKNQLYVNVQRSQSGLSPYLSQTLTLTSAWQDYTLNFTANETGSAVGTVGLTLEAIGSNVELDDVSLEQTNSSASNPTVFRDDVVNALKELNPGSIRMMAAGAALGSDVVNQLRVTNARYREGFNSSATTEDDVAYGIHEFLQLCQTVGADPWITIPTATTPQEMTDLIEYMTGDGSDSFSALRIARGQSAPWTSVFNKIHIELGNETWNGDFKGESIGYPAYPQWANQVFGAARATNGFVASSFDLVLDGWSSAPGYTQIELSYSTQHDSVDIAPYLLYSLNNESQALQFGAMFAEPEMWSTPGGIVYRNLAYGQAATRPANLNVYEVNLGSIIGSPTQAQLDATQPSVGAGIAHADHMLQMMRLGVKYQNAFSLPQFEFLRGDGSTVHLWGLVVDMGTTNRRRPQFLTQALANSVIGGTMLQTAQTGLNPTWSQPLSSDNVQMTAAHEIQSFAFNNNGSVSVILFNLSQTTARAVTLSGANAPSGSVQMSQVTSANITDNNETANTVQTAAQTLSAFNPSSGLTLPPFSMTVLTASTNTVQVPAFSVAAGTYTSAQSVSITDPTSGSTIYYTTDGSTPTTGSTVYAGAITVSSSETLQAMAAAPGMASSAVSSASYVISQAAAAAPVFSVGSGNYSSAQTVSIADATTGAVVYYTTDGTTPTTGSSVYTTPLTVSASETLQAIATASGYTQSAVASASYTIAKPVASAPVFSIGSGNYSSAPTVSIVDGTTGAVVYYTMDGTTPTTGSIVYTTPLTVSASETLQAIATASGYTQSAVASASYTIAKPVASAPVFSVATGSYSSAQTVSIVDATSAAIVHYTTDGTTPTTGSSIYTTPLIVSTSETLQAITTASGYTQSAVSSASYTIAKPVASAPVFSIGGGGYSSAQTVSITDATTGSTVYYTTNGATPTTGSSVYAGPITVSQNETLEAIAIASGYTQSGVSVASYVIAKPTTATPQFSKGSAEYTSALSVSIEDATNGAAIYYTVNGTTPTAASSRYTGAIAIKATLTLKAIAIAANCNPSAVASASYSIESPTPTAAPAFSIKPGTYTESQKVALTDATAGSAIYYTTNGAAPTTASIKYGGPIEVTSTITIKAIALAANHTQSSMTTAEYTIAALPVTAAPAFSLKGATYTAAQSVALTDATAGSVIYFTSNGTIPTTASTKYAAPIEISATETIKAIAIAPKYQASAVSTATYTIDKPASAPAATPVFSVKSGTYTTTQKVAIGDKTAGAVIFFTVNGSKSAKYTGPIEVTKTTVIKAIASAPKFANSAEAVGTFTIEVLPATATPTFSVKPGTYAKAQAVVLDDATAQSTIFVSVNGAASVKYSGPIKVTKTTTIKAIATAAKHTNSAEAVGAYVIKAAPAEAQVATPTFSLKAGTYATAQTVTLKDATAGATILYSVNGAMAAKYTSPIKVTGDVTITASATAAKYANSDKAVAIYLIEAANEPQTATPTFSLKAGTYTKQQAIAIKDATAGAVIFVSVNGSPSAKYTAPIKVTKTTVIKAFATAAKHTSSQQVAGDYVIVADPSFPAAATPTFNIKPGTYNTTQMVALSDASPGTEIMISVNGTPARRYTAPIEVNKTSTIKAIAEGNKYITSAAVSGMFTIKGE